MLGAFFVARCQRHKLNWKNQTMARVRELREKRAQLAEQAKAILNKADAEKRKLTSEETRSFDRLHEDIGDLRDQIEREERGERQGNVERELSTSLGVRSMEQGTSTDNGRDYVESGVLPHDVSFRSYLIATDEEARAQDEQF